MVRALRGTKTVLKMKVGLVGCGNIGADLCIALQKGDIPAEIGALTDIDAARAKLVQRSFQLDVSICTVAENGRQVDFLVECAGADAVAPVVEAAVENGIDCLIMSVGGLMANSELYNESRERGIQIHIPSGALCGLDGIRAAMEAGLHSVRLTTRKPPKGLLGAPYLVENGINVEDLEESLVVFDGNALDAVKAFPQNVNVAASLSFAGIGPKETKVRLIADPNVTLNIHEIEAEGAFGHLKAVTENLPSPRNAKSSYLASLSAVADLRSAATGFVAKTSPVAGTAKVASNG